jgi:hypothetical protein
MTEWKDHWIKRDTIQQGYILSTVKPFYLAWYGVYETALVTRSWLGESYKILEGYETLEEALIGHEKYKNMTLEEIELLPDAEPKGAKNDQ